MRFFIFLIFGWLHLTITLGAPTKATLLRSFSNIARPNRAPIKPGDIVKFHIKDVQGAPKKDIKRVSTLEDVIQSAD
jgi:hypothetical protein